MKWPASLPRLLQAAYGRGFRTQTAVAAEIGISKQLLNSWLHGRRVPSVLACKVLDDLWKKWK